MPDVPIVLIPNGVLIPPPPPIPLFPRAPFTPLPNHSFSLLSLLTPYSLLTLSFSLPFLLFLIAILSCLSPSFILYHFFSLFFFPIYFTSLPHCHTFSVPLSLSQLSLLSCSRIAPLIASPTCFKFQ